MNRRDKPRSTGCDGCLSNPDLGFQITMAFQPIIRASTLEVFAHEALVRGTEGQSAGEILAQVTDANRYRFDQLCRSRAIELASKLDLPGMLSINFLPNAVYEPARCIRSTIAAAEQFDFPLSRIIFEVNEGEHVLDRSHLKKIFTHYQATGFSTAIDDFGAGYANLGLFADLLPDYVKIDMDLIRGIDSCVARRAVVSSLVNLTDQLGTSLIAEGIEAPQEYDVLLGLGIDLFQGFFFAKPVVEGSPKIDWTAVQHATGVRRSAP